MLKSLELFGFKSFADRTRFDFAPGITCVVGPNGSGKSNVVDSIKWVLGDQSPKSLRGKEMTDVIFNGSASRKPAGFAEATLTFDNSKGLFTLDSAEVQVGRRIYRSGEAEYIINRVPARLKDVRELFLGTGAGTAAYSIIEQGRVDALLQATTVNRRVVFEEAAGISRFKLRKVDAQRKLERVGQNLLRLTDIVDEVHGQLTAVRSQATKAARFREYTDELRALRIGLAADDYRDFARQLADSEVRSAAVSAQLEDMGRRHQEIEAQQAAADAQVAEAEDRLRAVERQAAENREAIASHEATLLHQSARDHELEAELARLQQQQDEISARAEAAVGQLHQTVGNLEQFTAELAGRRAALQERERELRDLEAVTIAQRVRLEQDREQQLTCLQESSVLANRVTGFDSQFAALETARQRASLRRDQLRREMADAEAEYGRRQLRILSAETRMEALRAELQKARELREAHAVQQDERQRQQAELRERRSAGQARRSLLEDLEFRQEGLGIGVKEILQRAANAEGSPWNTVLGSVADLLVVDLEQAALLEVALGSRAQVLVLSELEPLVRYLNSGKCQISGRVGFLTVAPGAGQSDTGELQQFVPLPADALPNLEGRPGVAGRADRLVRSSSGISRLAEQLLADTWVVHTLDVALALAAGEGQGCRFVTLQGELLEANQTLFVGTVRSETALVSRKSELRVLKNELVRLDRQIEAGETELTNLGAQLAVVERQLATAHLELERFSATAAELKSALGNQELDVERLQRDLEEVQDDMDQQSAALRQLQADSVDTREELQQANTRLRELQQQLQQGEAGIADSERRRQELARIQTTEQLDLAKQEERLHSLEHARTRLDQELLERDLHREEAERRFQVIATKREQLARHLEAARAAVTDLTARNQIFADRVAVMQQEKDGLRQLRSQLSEQELRLRHERRELKDELHTLELRTREWQQQREHLIERIRDEYHVELAEEVEAGASAILRTSTRPTVADAPEDAGQGGSIELREAAPETPKVPEASDPRQQRARVEADIDRLRRKLKAMGAVNTDSLRDLDELEARYSRLSTQLQDLVEAKAALEEIVRRINTESKRLFTETFVEIRKEFQELFRKLFGGGDGDIVLEDPEDVLDCGIDIVARPPGKELRSISLLSGGEKTLTAVALLLAIFKSKPSPFCILDEVDAALDEGNVERYMRVIQEFQSWTQFIVITHSKRTMTAGDVLYGVTMEEAGVSKRMSVRFEDVSEDGHFRNAAA